VTQQRQTVAGAIGETVIGKTGIPAPFRMLAKALGASTQEATEKSIQELLFKAVMDPEFAIELAKTPTSQRITSMTDRLTGYAIRTGGAGLKAGLQETARAAEPMEQLGQMMQQPQVDLESLSEAELDQIIAASGVEAADTALPTTETESFQPTSFIPEEMPEMTLTSDRGIDFIKQHEGLRLAAYDDGTGKKTIGYGHTKDVPDKITKEEAEAKLIADIEEHESAVKEAVKVPLTQEQFDALTSFTFNLGAGAFKRSTLLKKINEGDLKGAADEFLKWDKARVKGKLVPMRGLTKRRQAERELFLEGLTTKDSGIMV
jgi:lysozyme